MKSVFVDTTFWISRIDPRDQLYTSAGQAARQLGNAHLITTDAVLGEVLNFFAGAGVHSRLTTSNVVESILDSPTIEVIYQGRGLFRAGLEFYRKRQDKGYSLTDCVSMLVMQDRGIMDVLTDDKHFRQEGFNTLL